MNNRNTRVSRSLSYLVAVAGALLLSVRIEAATPVPVQPGEYVTEGGWGTLTVKRGKEGAMSFSIEALAGNGHSCSLDGTIRDGVARLPALDEGKPCVVEFRAKTIGTGGKLLGIEVQERSEPQLCRYFCGARADFNGAYLTPPRGCRPSTIKDSRRAFIEAYQRKEYARAESWLAPLMVNCAQVIEPLSTYNIRNDLAITYYHLGERAACLRMLGPMSAILNASVAKIQGDYPPTDADNLLAVRKAGLTNRALCESLPTR